MLTGPINAERVAVEGGYLDILDAEVAFRRSTEERREDGGVRRGVRIQHDGRLQQEEVGQPSAILVHTVLAGHLVIGRHDRHACMSRTPRQKHHLPKKAAGGEGVSTPTHVLLSNKTANSTTTEQPHAAFSAHRILRVTRVKYGALIRRP